MPTKPLPEVVSTLYEVLEPLTPEDRSRVVSSVLTLLGDPPSVQLKGETPPRSNGHTHEQRNESLGQKANRWMTQNGITEEMIQEIFHIEDGKAEVIAAKIPGSGKRGMTQNCYLLAGVQSLLTSGEAKFTDTAAIELCKTMGCHDQANHAKTRKELGSNVAGSKSSGFTLPAPGLRAAADLIKTMASPA